VVWLIKEGIHDNEIQLQTTAFMAQQGKRPEKALFYFKGFLSY
jgi:hypothetical protein